MPFNRHCPTNRALATLCVLAALTLLASSVDAQLVSRPDVIKPVKTRVDNARFRSNVITVKFRDGLLVRLRNGSLTDMDTGSLDGAEEVLASVAGGRWNRTHFLPEDKLDELRQTAQRNLGRAVADLNLQFTLFLPRGADAAATIDAFNAIDGVEIALPIPKPVPPPLPPNFQPNQVYEDAGPAGISAEEVWANLGITGGGIKIVDVEYSWNLNHLDLPPTTVLGFDPVDPFNNNNHGTAVLGEVAAIENGWGVTGIAYDAQFYVAGTWNGAVWDVGGAIITALGTLGPGDIIIIEQQFVGPNGGTAYIPIEWWLPWYNAIVTAVGNGVIVVEAAGNGSQNLDDPIYSMGNSGHWPFLPENDSGAIIVGAGAAWPPFGSDVAGSRLWFSNYGSTVDLQGWGEGVWTTGYGGAWSSEGVNLWYTSVFGGTSSASPIVAGACALLESAYKDATGLVLTPSEVKQYLQETGWPQTSGTYPASQNIGPRPDAYQAILAVLPTGACCFGNGSCTVETQDDCKTTGGTYQGDGTDCGSVSCPLPCPADLDGDGSVGAGDLLALLASWGPCEGCAADFNADGEVGAADLLILLASWGPCT